MLERHLVFPSGTARADQVRHFARQLLPRLAAERDDRLENVAPICRWELLKCAMAGQSAQFSQYANPGGLRPATAARSPRMR